MAATSARFAIQLTRPDDSLAWIRIDVVQRLVPMTLAVAVVWAVWRPGWLGLDAGDEAAQLRFGAVMLPVMFIAAALMQRWLSRRRRTLRVSASGADAALQAGYYVLNAAVEEGFFRGLLQGGLGALTAPVLGFVAATAVYVLYHRLGRWTWPDVFATALAGIPLGLAFWLLPGPPSLTGVVIAHFGATCGFLGPGPWLMRRLRLLPD
jgi:membrane protease YdiL (CAAX protease family)